MKKLLLLAPLASVVALFSACGSSHGPDAGAESNAMVYVSSARAASDIAQCLDGRLSRVSTSRNNGVTTLTVGSASNGSYFIQLTPSGSGSVVKVMRGAGGDPPEEELRFAIARCTT
jgi:hypothetical protein